jgi:RNA polymerase-binding transcription factor DksA
MGDPDPAMSSALQPPTRRCSLCDKPIGAARLEALSGVTTCIACARKYPKKYDTSHIEISEASKINKNGFAPND